MYLQDMNKRNNTAANHLRGGNHYGFDDEKPTRARQVFEAQSKHPASKKTDFPVKHEFVAWDYTRHNDGGRDFTGNCNEVLPSGAVRIHQVVCTGRWKYFVCTDWCCTSPLLKVDFPRLAWRTGM